MKIVADEQIPFIKEYFDSCGELILKPGRFISAKDVKDATILLVRSITAVDEALLAKSSVKFVGSITAGFDHLDTAWLDSAGIAWAVAHGFNAPPVADYIVSTIAALEHRHQDKLRAAVIGVGKVGRLVVDRLKLLNFDVTVCDPPRADAEENFESAHLDELYDFDLVTLHVPLTKKGKYPTHHFIDKKFLQKQKRNAVLVNTSRGAVINSDDLLRHGTHLKWCLDVWEHEPNVSKTILERASIATPHIAGYSVQSKIRGIDQIYRALCDKKIITPQHINEPELKNQSLAFAGKNHHWQDIVLGIFNPLLLTDIMRTMLLSSETPNLIFDELRHQFNYRHEFAYTQVSGVDLARDEQQIVERLGINIQMEPRAQQSRERK